MGSNPTPLRFQSIPADWIIIRKELQGQAPASSADPGRSTVPPPQPQRYHPHGVKASTKCSTITLASTRPKNLVDAPARPFCPRFSLQSGIANYWVVDVRDPACFFLLQQPQPDVLLVTLRQRVEALVAELRQG